MSITALQWAFKLPIRPATKKLVMLVLADYTNDEDGLCWPSMARMVERTSLDERTISAAIGDMIDAGLIADTGRRIGATKQVKVLKVAVGAECPEAFMGRQKTPKIVGVSSEEDPQFCTDKTPNFVPKDPQFCTERPPILGDVSLKEPLPDPALEPLPLCPPSGGHLLLIVEPITLARHSAYEWLTGIPAAQWELADFFERWYAAYPRKEAPFKAWAAFVKAFRVTPPVAKQVVIMESLRLHCLSEQWQNKKVIPYPAKWVNDRRWEGEAPPPPNPNGTGRQSETPPNRPRVVDTTTAEYRAYLARQERERNGTASPPAQH